ncbi:RING-type E3 ubiquitin transferase [Salvia divinorum]|uniref:RING-type E3 ubiquitin transferase n=1 Tax=Salvia divinorum TaxID=28513 RepID=A0ABD1GW74_SALDI
MGAIAKKLISYPDKIFSILFLRILPESIHLGILALCIFFKHYQIFAARRAYAAAVTRSQRPLRPPPGSSECSVCLSELAAEGEECCELAACGHAFHRGCVERWLIGHAPTCPLCRAAAVPEEAAAEYRRVAEEEEDDWIEKEFALVLLNALDVGRCNHGIFS